MYPIFLFSKFPSESDDAFNWSMISLFEKSRWRSYRCCGLSSVTYIITHLGLGGFSGLIAAAIGSLIMLMSEPTAKSNVKLRGHVCLSSQSRHYSNICNCNMCVIFLSPKFPSGLLRPSIYDFCMLYNLMNSFDLCANLTLQELKCDVYIIKQGIGSL